MSGIEALLAGHTLADRYRIEAVIGRGGMGAVYRAMDERLEREVAVKVITVAVRDDEAREQLRVRFHREAKIAARLEHPNVVTVYDFGTDAKLGLDFLVMELLGGEDLAECLARRGPPPLARSLMILREAARGVGAGHRVGLVHRDVKPGNIFLGEGEHAEGLRVKVLDFGIAKIAADTETMTQLTRAGEGFFSPAYASPEQLRGESELSPAADVFSLGVIGYELMVGARPWGTGRRSAFGAPPEPIRPLRQQNSAVPAEVERAIMRALAPEPGDRFPDATAFVDALGETAVIVPHAPPPPIFVPPPPKHTPAPPRVTRPDATTIRYLREADSGAQQPETSSATSSPRASPAEAPPPETEELTPRSRTGTDPYPRRLALRLLFVALLVGGASVAWWATDSPPTTEEIARPESPTGSAPPEPESTPISVVQTDSAPAADAADSVDAEETAEGEEAQGRSAGAINAEGQRLFERRRYAAAAERFRLAAEREPGSALYRNNYGWALHRLGQNAAAQRELERAIRLNPRRAIAYANLGEVRAALGDTAAAIAAYERFLQLNTDERREQTARGILSRLRRGRF